MQTKEEKAEYCRKYYQKNKNFIVYLLELPDAHMYVGSTNNYNHRIICHKHQTNCTLKKLPVHKAILETGGWDQVTLHVLMKDVPNEILRRCEQHFIDMLPEQLSLNSNGAVGKKKYFYQRTIKSGLNTPTKIYYVKVRDANGRLGNPVSTGQTSLTAAKNWYEKNKV
jgi:hypothetical protein